MRFKVGDILINKHTGDSVRVIKYEPEWAIPVYEVEDIDSGRVDRFNQRYTQHWDLVVTNGGEDE
jgi:hypothetical protein|tara:strand:- start:511 stop:705 length:195 start_codon:yes stop_codon:yes gene_type:complete